MAYVKYKIGILKIYQNIKKDFLIIAFKFSQHNQLKYALVDN